MHYPAAVVKRLRNLERRSNCSRRHVSCVLLNKSKEIITEAYNGSQYPQGCERPNEQGNCGCTHAEVVTMIRHNWREQVDEVWLTCAPCAPCAKAIAFAEPSIVYYLEDSHPMLEGFAVLDAAGISHAKVAEPS